jgi:hypothetical protein
VTATAVLTAIKRFGAFWYDFIIGDDWRVAGGVVVALGIAAAIAAADGPAWLVVPLAVAILLTASVWRAARS